MTADAAADPESIRIRPFDPTIHDRTAFSSGVDRIDNFLKRTAKKHQAGDFTRVWVAVEGDSPKIVGYYAINAHHVDAGDLPPSIAKHAPRHGTVPAAYLSMIGVDRSRQGNGLGRVLLVDAFRRVAAASEQIGLKAIVLDVIGDGGDEALRRREGFYRRMGFEAFPRQPTRLFIALETVKRALA